MIQSKYKIGDKVTIRSLDWYNANKDEIGEIDTFVPDMAKYCGKKATIEEVFFPNTYFINLDRHFWYWKDEMFEES